MHCSKSRQPLAGKRVYNLDGFKDWAGSGGEVER